MKVTTRFNPKLFELMRGYSRERFIKDVGAGLTVSVVALPLAMAFAIASGLPPQSGLFTAIIAGFLISLFSGSRVQIGGPAGAFIVIVYGIVEQYGVGGLLLATFMSGVMLWLMGFLRMGVLIKFIPVSVIIGFTNGIAVLIALSQIKDFFGLQIEGKVPAEFFALVKTLWQALPTWNGAALAVSLLSLAIIVIWQAVMKRKVLLPDEAGLLPRVSGSLALIPGSIVALVAATLLVAVLQWDVDTIGSRFGGIPQGLPEFTVPAFGWAEMKGLFLPAMTLAVLGAIESLLCARVADSMIRDKHDSNQELLAQGFANMVVPFFGGMPATGTIARTVTNIKNGGNSPVAGMIHALALLLVVLVAAPLAQYIPLPALSAILMFVAWNMGEWREFVRLRTFRMPYRISLLLVFVLTVVVDLTVAVEVGIFFACFIFIYRISSLTTAERFALPQEMLATDGVAAYKLTGAIFFGAVKLIDDMLADMPAKALVLDFSSVIYIDSSGEESLEELLEAYHEKNIPILVYGLRQQPWDLLQRTGWLKRLGQENVLQHAGELENRLAALD
ncbi:MAG: SulP family inorganic anion transporter [Neisseria sp.]|uniref:SulP family inorganic anion transporter n=1 Tax=Neisseria sp. TaxID=192066 RepID=UPI0026DDC7AC|nr:SulP family inorganic anion transporter [Neisseria sp.]MDO4248942.1 SulP family inorganic anion transporter [Neisseria sp.]